MPIQPSTPPISALAGAALLALGSVFCSGACAASFGGIVTHVSDGDTLWVQPDDHSLPPIKLRLQGIDAPERCQAWGEEAGAALAARVQARHVWVRVRARDVYARAIAQLRLDGEDIGAWMVAHGHAWSPGYGRHGGPYAAQERDARAARRGLFADPRALEPRLFRQRHGPCAGAIAARAQ